MDRKSFNPALNPSRSPLQDTESMRQQIDMADEDFRDEDELYLAQDFDELDTERYQDIGPRVQRGEHYGKGPKNWRPSDLRIKEEVCEALSLNEELDASAIEVEVQEGMVVLNGFVSSREHKRLAEDILEDITGMMDIRNRLTVKIPAPLRDNSRPDSDWSYPVE